MNRKFSKALCILLSLAMICCFAGCGGKTETGSESTAQPSAAAETNYENARTVKLNGSEASLDGVSAETFDYTWHCDPSVSHDEVKDAPAEYHTGTKPETDAAIFIDNDLPYYPQLPEDGFKKINYDGETEWAYYYTDGEHNDFIFATLPNLGGFPSQMMHSEQEASENKVLHITEPGTYILEGKWNGQILVDLGDKDETFTDENAKITVILNGADINCTVAPGIVFYSAYECDNTWEDRDEHTAQADTSAAGVNVIIADGTENTVNGTNVFRMLKTKYKDEDSTEAIKVQKKMRKTDAAFYSYVTFNITGEKENTGKLEVTSGFEGMDSELHLSVNGGNITINSRDDGMNVNEDNVSVISFNGGTVTLNAGLGAEGDGVDSNGFIVVNGGTVNVNNVTPPDSALDSEDGITYNSGKIIIDGEEQTYTPGSVFNETGREGGTDFGGRMLFEDKDFDIKDFKEKVAALDDDAELEDVLEILGFGGGEFNGNQPPEKPDGEPGEMPPEMPGGGQGQPPEKPSERQ